jgi:hypothetical protein
MRRRGGRARPGRAAARVWRAGERQLPVRRPPRTYLTDITLVAIAEYQALRSLPSTPITVDVRGGRQRCRGCFRSSRGRRDRQRSVWVHTLRAGWVRFEPIAVRDHRGFDALDDGAFGLCQLLHSSLVKNRHPNSVCMSCLEPHARRRGGQRSGSVSHTPIPNGLHQPWQ